MSAEEVPYSLSVACDWCGAEEGSRCTAPGRKERENHKVRWETIQHRVRTWQAHFRLKADDPRFGLQKGDVLLCVNYPYDAKVTVLRRESDGYEPQCNQYLHDVEFLRWVDKSGAQR